MDGKVNPQGVMMRNTLVSKAEVAGKQGQKPNVNIQHIERLGIVCCDRNNKFKINIEHV